MNINKIKKNKNKWIKKVINFLNKILCYKNRFRILLKFLNRQLYNYNKKTKIFKIKIKI